MKTILSILIILAGSVQSFCQDYVVTLAKDTLYGEVRRAEGYVDTHIFLLTKDQSGKTQEQQFNNTDKLLAFKTSGKLYQVMEINQGHQEFSEGMKYPNVIVEKMVDGRVSLYSSSVYSVRLSSLIVNYYFKRSNEARLQPAYVSQRGLMEYFKDCPVIIDEMKHKKIGKQDVQKITEIYNGGCKTEPATPF